MAVHTVDVALKNRDELLSTLKNHMALAQNRMKQHADSNLTERDFAIGDYVYLKLHPYRQKSLLKRPSHKLSPRYYDPFKILERIVRSLTGFNFPHNPKFIPHFMYHFSRNMWATPHLFPQHFLRWTTQARFYGLRIRSYGHRSKEEALCHSMAHSMGRTSQGRCHLGRCTIDCGQFSILQPPTPVDRFLIPTS